MNVGSALRAVVPVGAGVRPLYLLGIRHAVDREARCSARHSVSRAIRTCRSRPLRATEQFRAAVRRRVGRQRRRQDRRPGRLRDLLQPHQRNVGARRRGAVDRHACSCFNGRIEDPYGSLNTPVPPSGVPISGEFGCVPTSAYPGLNCPLYPLPLNFVYNDLEMATPYRAPLQHVVPASAHERLHGRRGVHRPVWLQARRASPLQSGAVHQFAADWRLAPIAQNINDRVLYEPGIIGPTSRVLETRYQSWYNGLELKGDQAHEPRVHVLGLLHALEGASTRCSIRAPG